MKKYSQSSLVDFLTNLMPGLQKRIEDKKNIITDKNAEVLFKIWMDKKSQINDKVFTKPAFVQEDQIESLQKQGLIRKIGDKIQVTSKGSGVIKTMILGDDRSVFEMENDEIVNYNSARHYASTPSKMKKNNQKIIDNWWNRFAQVTTKKSSYKLDNATRRKITQKLNSVGLDGNGRFKSTGEALQVVWKVLDGFNISISTVLNGNLFLGKKGRRRLELTLKASEKDPFTPGLSIENDIIFIWDELNTDTYEILCYLT